MLVIVAAFAAVIPALPDGPSDASRIAVTPPSVVLLEADVAAGDLRVRDDARNELRAAAGRATVRGVPMPGAGLLDLDLERFSVTAPGVRFVTGPRNADTGFDPSRVALFRGAVDGHPGSTAFLAVSDLGVTGTIDLGAAGGRAVIGPRDPARRGLANDGLVVAPANGLGAPLGVEPCVVHGAAAAGGVAGEGGGAPVVRHVELAVDTDFEFFSLFGDADAANAYVLALYGAVSDIYQRELSTRVTVTYVRLWDTPLDLYNEPDPLVPFRTEWESNQVDVPRDVAQLLTGRRNLPYGGVAYLSALCGGFGYSVNGYMNGSFLSPESADPGNWDLVVVAHELGHNCGTLHTHDYGLDGCASGETRRAGIMSYCHTVSGGVSNVDMRFETPLRGFVDEFLGSVPCVGADCDGNGIDDAIDIAEGTLADANGDGVPDGCQDCDGDGVLDPEAIAAGSVPDIDGNGVPDGCQPDCNGNGVPDAIDIGFGTSADAYLDGVPDECETDCDGDGTSDYVQIIADMSLDRDRDAVLDACQDCDGNGVNDFNELGDSVHLWVASSGPAAVRLFHPRSGAPVRSGGAATGGVSDLVRTPSGTLLAARIASDSVVELDAVTGEPMRTLVPAGAGGLDAPTALLPLDDGRLLVASSGSGSGAVLAYDLATGAFEGVLVSSVGVLAAPFGLLRSPDGTLLVSTTDGRVLEFDLQGGTFLRVVVSAGSGGLSAPRGMLVLPDASLLVASGQGNAILRYDLASGDFLGRWDLGGNTNGFWGLRQPWALRLDATGARVLATSGTGAAAVHAYDAATGLFLRSFYVLDDDIPQPTGFVVLPATAQDCNANGILDACDIASGRSADANGDGVPDECTGPGPSPDLDGSGTVDGGDLGVLLSAWGACAGCPADLDGNGTVDGADLGTLLAAWGSAG